LSLFFDPRLERNGNLRSISHLSDKEVRKKPAMEGDTLHQKKSVLIVDRSPENCEVLQTVLNRRGVQAFTANHTAEGVELSRRLHPDLILLDLELDDGNSEAGIPPFWANGEENNVPIILLGSIRRNQPPIPGSQVVSKPYHYGPLIRRIEEMLSR
jgi:DNA-binding response OmpR family regulator